MENEFNKGFNQGYILKKYSNEMATTIYESFQSSDQYILGFNEGLKEASLELQQIRLKKLNSLRVNREDEQHKER